MHFCTCKVRLADDMRMEVMRDAFNPVSYPEIEIIRFVHGDSAVVDVKAVAEVTQTPREEKERLLLIYGHAAVETVFPGKNPQMQMEMPKATLDPNQVWRNPLDKEVAGYDVDPTIVKEEDPGENVKVKAKTKTQTQAKARVLEASPFSE